MKPGFIIVALLLFTSLAEAARISIFPSIAQSACDAAKPDDVLVCEAGTYPGLTLRANGAAGHPITLICAGAAFNGYVIQTGDNWDVFYPAVRGVRNGLQNNNAALRTGSNSRWIAPLAESNTGGGIGIFGSNVEVWNPIARKNGHFGLGSSDSKNVKVIGGEVYENNTGVDNPPWAGQANTQKLANGKWQVQAGWEAGFGKMAKVDGFLFWGTRAHDNQGVGIWFDISNKNFVIRGCESYRNMWPGGIGAGAASEISEGPGLIEDSLFRGNAGAGVSLWECQNMTVRNNEILAENGQGYGVEFRNLDRGSWMLKNINVSGNRFHGVLGGAGPQPYVSVPKTGVKNPFSAAYMQANNIVTGPNTYVPPGSPILWKPPVLPAAPTMPGTVTPPPTQPVDPTVAQLQAQLAAKIAELNTANADKAALQKQISDLKDAIRAEGDRVKALGN